MNAKQFFTHVVDEHYKGSKSDPTNFAKLWSTAVSMNTIPEYVALHREEYPELKRTELDQKADGVRGEHPVLKEINSHVIKLKHVRSHKGQEVTGSSTDILPDDPKTFADLTDVVDRAYPVISTIIKDLK